MSVRIRFSIGSKFENRLARNTGVTYVALQMLIALCHVALGGQSIIIFDQNGAVFHLKYWRDSWTLRGS